jgi:hypothetical protein
MRIILSILLRSVGSSFFVAPAVADKPQSFQDWLVDRDVKFEEFVQQSLRQFELVKSVRAFDTRLNATEKVSFETVPSRAVLTLHDIDTGEPLESCTSPCSLSLDPANDYGLAAYRAGHIPVFQGINIDIPERLRTVDLGPDFRQLYIKKLQCRLEWQKSEKEDSDATPCFRIPPQMPEGAKRSGHCQMVFDVDETGQPRNIRVTFCTDPIYEAPSMGTIHWWHYTPKTERGQALVQTGIESKMTFRLADEAGNLIPE